MAFRRNKNVRLEQFIDGSWKTCKTVKLGKGHSLYEQRKAEGVLMRLFHFQGPNKGSARAPHQAEDAHSRSVDRRHVPRRAGVGSGQ